MTYVIVFPPEKPMSATQLISYKYVLEHSLKISQEVQVLQVLKSC